MKKSILFACAAVAALSVASCSQSTTTGQTTKGGDREELYSGIIPAADAQGIAITLRLSYDDDHNYTDGDYLMVETALMSDTLEQSGLKIAATSYTEGDFTKESKVVDGDTINYIRLKPDAKDTMGVGTFTSDYFVINPDGTLTMTGDDLVKSVVLNYNLSQVK